MTVLQACEWLKATRLSVFIRESKWGFSLIEMVHLLALAALGGALLIGALRVFGIILNEQPLQATLRDLSRIIAFGILAMLLSGFLLFADGPLRYYGNSAFRIKLLLILAAAASAFIVYRRFQARSALSVAPMGLKVATAVSITLWLSAAVAGRVIGVL
jgi:hypothetical protein